MRDCRVIFAGHGSRSPERLSRISGYSILGSSYTIARTAMKGVWIAAISLDRRQALPGGIKQNQTESSGIKTKDALD
jgi:hypothetical protein